MGDLLRAWRHPEQDLRFERVRRYFEIRTNKDQVFDDRRVSEPSVPRRSIGEQWACCAGASECIDQHVVGVRAGSREACPLGKDVAASGRAAGGPQERWLGQAAKQTFWLTTFDLLSH